MKIQIITLFTVLTVVSLGAAEQQNLPAEIYQEIIANADTLADSAAVFSKLSQTSKVLKQRLDAALPSIVEQLAQKYAVENEFVALYFGPQRFTQLYPDVLKNTQKLSHMFIQLFGLEPSLSIVQSLSMQLLAFGALPKCADAPLEQYALASERYSIPFLKTSYLRNSHYDPGALDPCAFIANSRGGFTALSELSADDGSHDALLLLELDADVSKKHSFMKLVHVGFDLEEWSIITMVEWQNQQGYALVLKYRSTYRILMLPKRRAQNAFFFDIITRLKK